MFALLFKSTKENRSKIIQELTKLRPQPVEPEEEKVKEVEEEEEMEEKESRDKTEEKEEIPKMIDGKPVVFASMDIREKKKAQALLEETEQANANIINVNEDENEEE